RAMQALITQDSDLAQQVINDDAVVNELRFKIEEECLRLIATQQPAAGDLRTAMALVSIVTDIERMGDHATGIAKTVIRVGKAAPAKPLVDLLPMADAARKMFRDSLDAFIARDAEAARRIAAEDDVVDAMYKQVFDELIALMARDSANVAPGTYLLWCGHNLERLGDRVTNIAERIIFMTTGTLKELNV
ncbi:MAG: phosphate signaling complex protein PhoU, partial [Anaerolineales bacterium]